MKKLSRKQALEILTLIVDNEATENDKKAFFTFIQNDDDVRKKYESMLFVKQLLKTKYSPEKAPKHLRKKVSELVKDMHWEKIEGSKVDNNLSTVNTKPAPNKHKEEKPKLLLNLLKPARYLVAASVIFFFSLLTIELLEKSSVNKFEVSYDIEEMALSHFNTGDHISASLASFRPESSQHASELLESEMAHKLRLPTIEGADLRTVMYTTFADGYSTPVLEFYQSEINETVHVFAFHMDELERHDKFVRDPEAVKICKTYDDYHVKDINGKHVVSWKWGDYWYTAVSNHNGQELIALVDPVDPTWSNKNSAW